MSGTLVIVYFPCAKTGKIICLRTAFFAPEILSSPLNLLPPTIRIAFSTNIDDTFKKLEYKYE